MGKLGKLMSIIINILVDTGSKTPLPIYIPQVNFKAVSSSTARPLIEPCLRNAEYIEAMFDNRILIP
jgi:hypothetical protein